MPDPVGVHRKDDVLIGDIDPNRHAVCREGRAGLPHEVDDVHRLAVEGKQALLQAAAIQEIGNQGDDAIDRERRLLDVAQIAGPVFTTGSPPQEIDTALDRNQDIAEVMRQGLDQLVGRHAPSLLAGLDGDALRQLRSVGDHPDPARDRLQEANVVFGKEIGSGRGGQEDAAARSSHLERHHDGRTNTEPLGHASQLPRVLIRPAGGVGNAAEEYVDFSTAVRHRQAVHADGVLFAAHRRMTGAGRDQALGGGVVKRRVNLIRP